MLFAPFTHRGQRQQKKTVGAAASPVEDIAGASAKQKDLRATREGLPAYLRLLIAAPQSQATFATARVDEASRDLPRHSFAEGRGL